MKRSFALIVLAVGLISCRDYDLESRLTDQSGLVPADRFARYGSEQAQLMAIAREFGHTGDGSSGQPASYARTLSDVTDAAMDPPGFRLTVRFDSGWLTMITPIDDGKRGAETPGVPAGARPDTGASRR